MPAPEFGTAAAVVRFSKNANGRDYVVGDIHGMFGHLETLLSEVRFDVQVDRLFSVGDLVDRGPSSSRALEWMARPWFNAVRGNHEQFVLDSETEQQLDLWINHNGGAWWLELEDAEREKFRQVFASMPIAMQVETDTGTVGIVHADVPPFITWERFLELLENRDADTIFYSIWSRNRLSGQASSKAVGGNVDRIYCGHTPTRTTVRIENVIYIDTGAVYALDGYSEAKLTLVEINPDRHREFSVLTTRAAGGRKRESARLSRPVGDTTLAQVVRRQLDGDLVAGEYSNVVFSHLARDVGGNHVAVFEFDSEHGVGKGLDDRAFQFYMIFFRQSRASFSEPIPGPSLTISCQVCQIFAGLHSGRVFHASVHRPSIKRCCGR